jgi:hypothetical protein
MTASNLPGISDTNPTIRYFNNYFSPDITVSQNIDNTVLGFFESVTGNKQSARVLSSAVLYTAAIQGVDPLSVVEELQALSKRDQTATALSSSINNQQQNSNKYTTSDSMPSQNGFIQVNAYLAMFLNLSRVNTSLLGITNEPPRSKYVERTVLP